MGKSCKVRRLKCNLFAFFPYLLNICRKFEFLISQGSVATFLRCRMCLCFVATSIRCPAEQNVENRLRFDKATENFKVDAFVDLLLHYLTMFFPFFGLCCLCFSMSLKSAWLCCVPISSYTQFAQYLSQLPAVQRRLIMYSVRSVCLCIINFCKKNIWKTNLRTFAKFIADSNFGARHIKMQRNSGPNFVQFFSRENFVVGKTRLTSCSFGLLRDSLYG